MCQLKPGKPHLRYDYGMNFLRPLLLLVLTVWLALPLSTLAQSAPPEACHGSTTAPCMAATDAGCRHRALPSDAPACCHFYATAAHADVGEVRRVSPGAVQVGHERGGEAQFIPPVATRPPVA